MVGFDAIDLCDFPRVNDFGEEREPVTGAGSNVEDDATAMREQEGRDVSDSRSGGLWTVPRVVLVDNGCDLCVVKTSRTFPLISRPVSHHY